MCTCRRTPPVVVITLRPRRRCTGGVEVWASSGVVVTGELPKRQASNLSAGSSAATGTHGAHGGTNQEVEQEDRTLFGFRGDAPAPPPPAKGGAPTSAERRPSAGKAGRFPWW
jgi:hypothetical protein